MALNLDAVDQYVNVAAAASINNMGVLGYSAWLFPTSDGDREIISKSSSRRELRLAGTSPNMFLRGCVDTSSTPGCSDSVAGSIVLNQWQHVMMTYDDGGARQTRLFIDGGEVTYALQDTATGTRADDTSSALNIGRRTNASRFFGGDIDDVRIYNRIPTDAEIQTIHAVLGLPVSPDGLVLRLPMNEDAPGVVASGAGLHKDLSGQGNNGTPTNSPLFAEGILRFRRRVA